MEWIQPELIPIEWGSAHGWKLLRLLLLPFEAPTGGLLFWLDTNSQSWIASSLKLPRIYSIQHGWMMDGKSESLVGPGVR
jgi:hypothetical protein